MVSLIFSILCSAAVVHLLKFASRHTRAPFVVFASNYLTAGVLGIAVSGFKEITSQPPASWGLAALLGVLYVAGFAVFAKAIPRSGTAVSASVSRISVVVPIVASVAFFAESVSAIQIFGVVLAVLALPFAAPAPPWRWKKRAAGGGQSGLRDVSREAPASGLVWPLLLFFVVGLSDVGLKVRVELFPTSDPGWFFGMMFATACVICLVVALISGRPPSVKGVAIGVLLGTVNFGTAFFLSAALEQLAGFRVYTLNSIGVIIVAAIMGIVLWREWPGRHNYIFLSASIVAIVLLSG